MFLYLTSARADVLSLPPPCPQAGCAVEGVGQQPHLCFATEPLPGQGEHVYTVDLPLSEVERYEYKDSFRPHATARFFAVPLALLQKYPASHASYREVTGQNWNEWVVPVLDRRNIRQPRLRGKWAMIWVSRSGIADARVHHRQEGRGGEVVLMSLEVKATEEFDPAKDYILVEYHEEFEKDFGTGTKETWALETLGGRTPQWAIYPKAWQRFVWDKDVAASACSFIRTNFPSTGRDLEYATGRESKFNKARAWRLVADEVGKELTRRTHRRVDLGKLSGHSWTQVAAMPIRIAKRASLHMGETWAPPMEEPEFVHPDASGRYLLANLHGAYPKHGPGVDHSPQERPYQGLEGELSEGKKRDFDEHREPATVAPGAILILATV
jgi:hypothetical protein